MYLALAVFCSQPSVYISIMLNKSLKMIMMVMIVCYAGCSRSTLNAVLLPCVNTWLDTQNKHATLTIEYIGRPIRKLIKRFGVNHECKWLSLTFLFCLQKSVAHDVGLSSLRVGYHFPQASSRFFRPYSQTRRVRFQLPCYGIALPAFTDKKSQAAHHCLSSLISF